MKFMLLGCVCLCFMLTACHSQTSTKGGSAVINSGQQDFDFDVSFFPEDNNIAKSAVSLADGYLIAGQRFRQKGDSVVSSGLIKISPGGKLIQAFEFPYGKVHQDSRIENIFPAGANRFVQAGKKEGLLWVREVNSNLDVLRDTVFPGVPSMDVYSPKLALTDSGYAIVVNPVGIADISADFSRVHYTALEPQLAAVHITGFTMLDATYDSQSRLWYVVGDGCSRLEGIICMEHKQQLIVYDAANHMIRRTLALDGFDRVVCVRLYRGDVYVGGRIIHDPVKEGKRKMPRRNSYYIAVASYSTEGHRKSYFELNESGRDIIYDLAIQADRIHITGELFDTTSIIFRSLYLVTDLKGKLLEKRIFADDTGENRMQKVIQERDGHFLMMGKGKGWRIIRMK